MTIAVHSLVKFVIVSPPAAGKQSFVPRLLEKRYMPFCVLKALTAFGCLIHKNVIIKNLAQ